MFFGVGNPNLKFLNFSGSRLNSAPNEHYTDFARFWANFVIILMVDVSKLLHSVIFGVE